MPHFAPVRVRGGRYRLRRLLRQRGRAVAAGLAVTAAALVAAGPRLTPDADAPRGAPARGHPRPSAGPSASVHGARATDTDRTMTVPVRVADAATVRLLRPGDRVDVIAVPDPATGGRARVVASGARVRRAPEPLGGPGAAGHMDSATGTGEGPAGGSGTDDALVTLAVPRSTAARLAGAGATARLAVALR
ncbi:RcpC/CpaB family pilus assembly protein [Streptomyces sp. NPDC006743]|uniref:RcpC/CpaB family pilus assembly protein n=1 Tax=Streptomyces sp. NPDC006743 TaxID=3154480 RepID=UPI003452CB5C